MNIQIPDFWNKKRNQATIERSLTGCVKNFRIHLSGMDLNNKQHNYNEELFYEI